MHLLRQCVENVLSKASDKTREIVIWDNGSTDGTCDYLESLEDPRLKIVHSETNVGQNGYARGFAMTSSAYLVELDDDVVGAPEQWDAILLDAYRRLPTIGFLAADIEDDPHDWRRSLPVSNSAARVHPGRAQWRPAPRRAGRRRLRDDLARVVRPCRRVPAAREGGVLAGGAGLYRGHQVARLRAAVLADLKVHHTGGEYYGATSAEKSEFWAGYWKRQARRAAIKRLVFRIPFFRRLNARFNWFVAPS